MLTLTTICFYTQMREAPAIHQQQLEAVLLAIQSPLVLLRVVECMRNEAQKVDTRLDRTRTLLETFMVSDSRF